MNVFTRECPQCGKTITHKDKYTRDRSKKKKKICRSCVAIKIYKYGLGKLNLRKFANPFYGHKHSEETKTKLRAKDKSYMHTEEFKKRVREGMNGKTNRKPFYQCWVERYGKEIADKKLLDFKQKQSNNNKGSNNSMFGKPPPHGSGIGWSGWYKGKFFRSLLELSYIVNVLEKTGHTWQTGEQKKFSIQYTNYNGTIRNYYSDFIVENQMIECKPTSLWNSKAVQEKANAAIKFCKQHNMTYKLVDPERISKQNLESLYNNGDIKFMSFYDKKYKEKYS
jgi:hypothetical protein